MEWFAIKPKQLSEGSKERNWPEVQVNFLLDRNWTSLIVVWKSWREGEGVLPGNNSVPCAIPWELYCPWFAPSRCISQMFVMYFHDSVLTIFLSFCKLNFPDSNAVLCEIPSETDCPWLAPSSPSRGPSEPTDASHHLYHSLSSVGRGGALWETMWKSGKASE